MPASAVDPLTALATLRQRLDDVADALARADLAGLLDCEMRLAAAVSQVCAPLSSKTDKARLARELTDTAAALHRCSRLGSSLNDFTRVALSSTVAESSYDRTAQSGASPLHTFHGSM
jgi:hypothetical protein